MPIVSGQQTLTPPKSKIVCLQFSVSISMGRGQSLILKFEQVSLFSGNTSEVNWEKPEDSNLGLAQSHLEDRLGVRCSVKSLLAWELDALPSVSWTFWVILFLLAPPLPPPVYLTSMQSLEAETRERWFLIWPVRERVERSSYRLKYPKHACTINFLLSRDSKEI